MDNPSELITTEAARNSAPRAKGQNTPILADSRAGDGGSGADVGKNALVRFGCPGGGVWHRHRDLSPADRPPWRCR